MQVFREFKFEAAHQLPNVPPGHKCGRLHGHSYRVEIHVTGAPDPVTGMVIDFAEIKSAAEPLLRRLDHQFLNEIDGLENPTSENLARWVWKNLEGVLRLSSVVVRETATSGVIFTGDLS